MEVIKGGIPTGKLMNFRKTSEGGGGGGGVQRALDEGQFHPICFLQNQVQLYLL